MIATPAVDLKGGRCVQLVGGRPEDERVSLPDPVAVACRWWDAGFETLHVVDLDAALEEGDNREVVRRIIRETPARVQLGGGIRDDRTADELLELGADRIVVGTRAVDEPSWLAELSERHPRKVFVAVDVRNGEVQRKGWTEGSGLLATDYVKRLQFLPLAGVLWTDVDREGRLGGVDVDGARRMVEASAHPVWAAGGVSSLEDMEGLAGVGARGAVLGMALYEEALDANALAAAYGALPAKRGDEP